MQAIRPNREEMVDREGLRNDEHPTGDQFLLSGGESAQVHWPAPVVRSGHEPDYIHSHEHEHHLTDHEHHHKKSVLAKVKEKAKKWKSVLTKKKNNHDAEGNSPLTPSSLEDEDSIERDHEYHGGTMYESEMAPKMYKERASKLHASAPCPIEPKPVLNHSPPVPAHAPLQAHEQDKEMISQHQGAAPSIGPPNSAIRVSPAIAAPVAVPLPQLARETKKGPRLEHLDSFKERSTENNLIARKTEDEQKLHHINTSKETSAGQHSISPSLAPASAEDHDSSKTLTETVTEMLAPAYNMVSDATSKIAAKIQSPMAGDEMGAKMVWDKGMLMKEYLLQKLEPGEEEKALSEVITEVISPKTVEAGQLEDKGVVEKVKGAVSALLGQEEQTGTQQSQLAAGSLQTTSRPLFKSLDESSILTPTYRDGILIQATKVPREVLAANYADGVSIPTHKHVYEASIPGYKDNFAEEIPGDAHAHGALIAESKQNYTDRALFPQDSHEVSIRASEYADEASIPASEGIHGPSIHSFGYIHGVPTTTTGYAHGASITEPESSQLASIRASEGVHGDSTSQHSHKIPASEYAHVHGDSTSQHSHKIPASEYHHVHGDSTSQHSHKIPASEYPHVHGDSTSQHSHKIPASEYAHGSSIFDFVDMHRDSPPLPVSTHQLLSPASTNASPHSASITQPTVHFSENPSTFQYATNPSEEVEETSERRLQAYSN